MFCDIHVNVDIVRTDGCDIHVNVDIVRTDGCDNLREFHNHLFLQYQHLDYCHNLDE
jgi:hypothetical protein